MIAAISAALAAHGLILRGGLVFGPGEDAPAKSVLLVGNAGAGYWRQFSRWREKQPAAIENPLDTWSRAVIGGVAKEFGARVLMPNDRPFAPFQQWAMRAEGLKPSPLGILVHPDYGLWHAFRGALLFDEAIAVKESPEGAHPCDLCAQKPCLTTCPVSAFSAEGFAYGRCVAHVRGPEGTACRGQGCLARNACPVGIGYRYPAEVQAFHQKAFANL